MRWLPRDNCGMTVGPGQGASIPGGAFVLALALLLVPPTASAAGPGTPATQTAATRPNPALETARLLLEGGQWEQAAKAFDDILTANPQDPAALRGAAISYARLKNKLAEDRMIRALAVVKNDRMLTYDYAVVFYKTNPVNAAKVLRGYLDGSDKPDEFMLLAMGTTIQSAVRSGMNSLVLDDLKKFYFSYKTRLEQANPGYKLWGTDWLAEATYNRKSKAFDDAQRQAQAAIAQINLIITDYITRENTRLQAQNLPQMRVTAQSYSGGYWWTGSWSAPLIPTPPPGQPGLSLSEQKDILYYKTRLDAANQAISEAKVGVPEALPFVDEDPPYCTLALDTAAGQGTAAGSTPAGSTRPRIPGPTFVDPPATGPDHPSIGMTLREVQRDFIAHDDQPDSETQTTLTFMVCTKSNGTAKKDGPQWMVVMDKQSKQLTKVKRLP